MCIVVSTCIVMCILKNNLMDGMVLLFMLGFRVGAITILIWSENNAFFETEKISFPLFFYEMN